MDEKYLGHVNSRDPLFQYLKHDVFPRLGAGAEAGIRVFRTNGSNAVYRYEDRATGATVIGKFFYSPQMTDWELAGRRLDREFRNICEFRKYLSFPHYVARPIGRNDSLNRLLVIEYCTGESFDSIISRAIQNRDHARLYQKLTALAYFLASVHNRSAQSGNVNFQENCTYMELLVENLFQSRLIPPDEKNEFLHLRDRWRETPRMYQDCPVLVHGDATPSNFLFGDNLHVISFDLERSRRTDRAFDVGRIAGELQHFFMRQTTDRYLAEPFVGHFLWEYACHFPDRESAFRSVTGRIPFYLGITLLRIARNGYLEWNYRRNLIESAKECLWRYSL